MGEAWAFLVWGLGTGAFLPWAEVHRVDTLDHSCEICYSRSMKTTLTAKLKFKFGSKALQVLSLDAHIGDLQAQAIISLVGPDLLYVLEACLDRP